MEICIPSRLGELLPPFTSFVNTHILSSILVERFKLLEFLSSLLMIFLFLILSTSPDQRNIVQILEFWIPIKIIYITDITFLSVVRDVKL